MKTLIIIKREYLTRVRKRSFIILTLLIPVLLVGMVALVAGISLSSGDQKKIAVLDESKTFDQKLESSKKISFTFEHTPLETLKQSLAKEQYDAVLYIPPFNKNEKAKFNLFSEKQLGMEAQKDIENQLNDIVMQDRMQEAGVDKDKLRFLQDETISVQPNVEGKATSNEAAFGIGYACGLLLYMFMLFYGMSVMRSVMEEKTNRIAEIIVSSVKPYQLMLGKIIGVALVGLTQFLIWIALIVIAMTVLAGSMGAGFASNPEVMNQAAAQANTGNDVAAGISAMLHSVNWLQISLWFLFYFLGGYFLYASLFAAVGSLVNEDPQESNQLTMPITLPIILGFVIMSSAIKDPNSGLALFGSLFPLTSPIVMMARIPFGVPGWQLALSAVLLVGGFLGTTWMAGKIYRTGILMYGKKITFKEVGKWLMKK
ncbi:ABC transporter permease [Taibaiella chishuiensis]|uniref:ABC-2 type transport system permease protein n=1 Tax=Taibaiella chishuiensis TaxID=1434707 RepID=A0A2P8D5S3_9BACT|nr:ABC transporter permease [Taibaiella chishuiensis]PSK92575.1 ABC-2 type transport system permease protein [Taibaiella chishuiensis]